MLNPIVIASSNNVDNLYYHQAMKATDANEFQKAIIKKGNSHVKRNHWELIPREQVSKKEQVFPYVWSFK